MFANCSNWWRNDVICGWNELYGVQLTCDCNEPSATVGVARDVSGFVVCDWLETGAEKICGEVERLSTVSLQKIIYKYTNKQTNKSHINLFERRMLRTIEIPLTESSVFSFQFTIPFFLSLGFWLCNKICFVRFYLRFVLNQTTNVS